MGSLKKIEVLAMSNLLASDTGVKGTVLSPCAVKPLSLGGGYKAPKKCVAFLF